MEETNNLRKEYKEKRRALDSIFAREKSEEIGNKIFSLLHDNKNAVLCFYPANNEVDLLNLYQKLLDLGFKLYFPKTVGDDMFFYRIFDLSKDFSIGNFHIMEPKENVDIFRDSPAYVITPGLIFDKNGNRVGYGRGFYDRFFSKHNFLIKIGASYECQLHSGLEPKKYDVPLDYVVTEKEIYKRK